MNGVHDIKEVAVRIPPAGLSGDLSIPDDAAGMVLFAHGSGSSRHSARNKQVAAMLQQGRLATLLIDLLTEEEEQIDIRTRHLRFDIDLLVRRLMEVTAWLSRSQDTRHLHAGYFGASTGGGAALVAAAELPGEIGAVVSRGGRPDLAGAALPKVLAPVLLIVGGHDFPVIEMNESAQARMTCETRLEIVPGATHLFEEPGALDEVAKLALRWFQRYLTKRITSPKYTSNYTKEKTNGIDYWNDNSSRTLR